MRGYNYLTSLALRRSLMPNFGSFCQCRYFASLLRSHSRNYTRELEHLTSQYHGSSENNVTRLEHLAAGYHQSSRNSITRIEHTCTPSRYPQISGNKITRLEHLSPWNRVRRRRFHSSDLVSSWSADNRLDKEEEQPELDPLRDSVTFDMHMPIMVSDVLTYFGSNKQQVFLDMTFGAGGHSKILLDAIPDCKIIVLDRDPYAHGIAKQLALKRPGRVIPLLGRFSDLPALLAGNGVVPDSIDRALFDFGPSSMHLDDPARGFSFMKNGPLDMRMEGKMHDDEPTAAHFVNALNERTLGDVLHRYGQVPNATEIASAIVTARKAGGNIRTTRQLATIIESASPVMKTFRHKQNQLLRKGGKDDSQDKGTKSKTDKRVYRTKEYKELSKEKPRIHVATQTFMALRILVNNEFNEINYGLHHVHKYLKSGGICVTISFHSLEDSIVQHHFCSTDLDTRVLAVTDDSYSSLGPQLEPQAHTNITTNIGRWQPIGDVNRPSDEEIFLNPRCRSTIMRVAKKIS